MYPMKRYVKIKMFIMPPHKIILHRLPQYCVFKPKYELIDPKGPENIICTMMKVGDPTSGYIIETLTYE